MTGNHDMKIFLIRHGETTGDVEDRYGGWYDDHLTKRGLEQVKDTAQRLGDKGIEAIFSSPLIRAKETTAVIQSTVGVPVEYIDGFKERNYGILTGLTKQEALQAHPDVVARHNDYLNTDPEGERYEDFCARIIEALNVVAAREYKIIGIVTHGGPIRCILRYLGKDVPEKIADGAIIIIDAQSPAVFGGGCFWCIEAVFKEIKGVLSVAPGYAGGTTAHPTYNDVTTGQTGHVEVVCVTYDPTIVSYGDLLAVFFAAHDPATLNRQGGDAGTQYRSVIFTTTEEQERHANNAIRLLKDGGQKVVTTVEPLGAFYEAEEYHNDYYAKNREAPYCQLVIAPKIEKLQKQFQTLLK